MVTVVVGSVFVLFDIQLTILLPLLMVVGFGVLLALGSITIADLGKTGILKRLNDIKFFEKSTAPAKKAAQPVPVKKEIKKEIPKESDAKPGLMAHISTFFSSIRSLGSTLQQKSKQGKKVEDIDKLLDKTVSERVTTPPPASTAPSMSLGGAGAGPKNASDPDDPFMSLSGDEFDESLLEGLGDDDGMMTSSPASGEEPVFNPADFPDLEDAGPDLSPPALDSGSAAEEILKSAGGNPGGDLEEFSGLDGSDLSDSDLSDLDNLSFDDIEVDEGSGDTTVESTDAPAPPAGVPGPAAAPPGDSNAVKTAWIPSDAPKDANEMEDDVGTQADMAAFAGGSGGDEDLLSSLAADVKHVKKEQDISLLRELKDFRAPAKEIETELSSVLERMSIPQPGKKNLPASKGIK